MHVLAASTAIAGGGIVGILILVLVVLAIIWLVRHF